MPYSISKHGSKYVVKKKDTGQSVARASSLSGAKGYVAHATHAEKKPAKGFPK